MSSSTTSRSVRFVRPSGFLIGKPDKPDTAFRTNRTQTGHKPDTKALDRTVGEKKNGRDFMSVGKGKRALSGVLRSQSGHSCKVNPCVVEAASGLSGRKRDHGAEGC